MWPFSDFVEALVAVPPGVESPMDSLVTHVRDLSQRDDFNDDFSMLELDFG
jgi:hypothetical protein